LPVIDNQLPMLLGKNDGSYDGLSERDIFYKVLVDLRRDVNDLKKVVFGLLENDNTPLTQNHQNNDQTNIQTYNVHPIVSESPILIPSIAAKSQDNDEHLYVDAVATSNNLFEDNLSLEAKEIELIRRALDRNQGKRKKAADDLGISERTLYRKIKQYELD